MSGNTSKEAHLKLVSGCFRGSNNVLMQYIFPIPTCLLLVPKMNSSELKNEKIWDFIDCPFYFFLFLYGLRMFLCLNENR